MIGVLIQAGEEVIAREFFELFKTPWEFYRSGKRYDVVICTRDEIFDSCAKLVLLYNSGRISFDKVKCIPVKLVEEGVALSFADQQLPLYGSAATFPANSFCVPRQGDGRESLTYLCPEDGRVALRIGYDLFRETHHLLATGQPRANAATPTLELHIALLRYLISGSGITLIEIPPIPQGYGIIACLTHDIDHPVLRNHWCDHTMFGFLYRATAGSVVDVLRGRKSLANLRQNLWAAGSLPFVYLGVAKDPWRGFERYLEIESGLGVTYFVIAQKDYPGRKRNGQASPKRAARYAVSDIKPELEQVISHAGEVALHGIDAWLDSASGAREQGTLSDCIALRQTGVRMHWLFFDENSPANLERAGFSYDSSVGYNTTVGYRVGTAQAYRPAGTTTLLELPLIVMDTALFYPNHLDLSEPEAKRMVAHLVENVERFGGALVINWHDRSIAPERLWGDFYLKMLGDLKSRGAWFPTVAQAVAWFRKRRSAIFGAVREANGSVSLSVSAKDEPGLPGLRVRVHRPRARSLLESPVDQKSGGFVDVGFHNNMDEKIELTV